MTVHQDRVRDLLDDLADGDVTGSVDDVTARIGRRRRIARSLEVASTFVVAAAIVVPVAVLTGGTTAPPTAGIYNGPASPTSFPPTNPLRLIGLWRVDGVPGEARDTSIAFGATNGDALLRPCGELGLTWRADHSGDFAAISGGGDSRCLSEHDFTVPWLARITGYTVERSGDVLLTARDDATVATLVPESALPADVTPDPRRDSPVTIAPVTAATRTTYAEPPPLPTGVTPATAADLVGRWTETGRSPGNYVTFEPGTGWSASDACNGYGGSYVVGPAGRLLIVSELSTLVGCADAGREGGLAEADRVGVARAGGDLLFYDNQGRLLERLTRQLTVRIEGSFVAEGGTEGSTGTRPLSGTVAAEDRGRPGAPSEATATTGPPDGGFTMQLPVGRYVFVGHSDRDPRGNCSSGRPVTITPAMVGRTGAAIRVTVACALF